MWHDLATARNERCTRFRKSQPGKADNLYTEILQLLLVEQHRKAGRIVDEHLSRDPLSGEAIVSWTELKLSQKKIKRERVLEYLDGLSGAFPEDPYYTLAKALVIAHECYGIAGEVDPFVVEVERAASLAEYSSDVLPDVLAKIAFNSASLGMWSFGMSYFIKAIKSKDKLTSAGTQPLILLSQKNEASVESYLKSLECLSGRVLRHAFTDVPLEVVVRTLCILLIAYEDLGICEAWPLATLLAHIRQETAREWADLNPLFSKYCNSWIQMQCVNGSSVCRQAK